LKVSSKVEMLDDPEQAIVTVLTMWGEEETESAATPAATTDTATPAKDEKKEDNK
jgi:hypothetical protein